MAVEIQIKREVGRHDGGGLADLLLHIEPRTGLLFVGGVA
jgi:hypothetical protein